MQSVIPPQFNPRFTQSLQAGSSSNRPVRASGSPPEKVTIKQVKFGGNPLKKIGDAIINFFAEIYGFVWGTFVIFVLLAGLEKKFEKEKSK